MEMTLYEFRKRGAEATNKLLTKEKRRKAALKGWRLKRKRERKSFTVKGK